MTDASHRPEVTLNPTQVRTFDELLAIGAQRPYAPPGLADELRDLLLEGTRPALNAWTERSLWLSKSQLFTALRCEGQLLADASAERTRAMHPATAVGIVAHRAIQLAYTHPNRPVGEYVREAVKGALKEERFAEFWAATEMGDQSDLLMQITSRVTGYLDSWPPLADEWEPRFEESFQAKVGGLTLAARADLVLGRPRGNGRQTMFIADWKSGSLREDALGHHDEAMFYALVSTLRHGIPPWRSTVFSLASGTYTDPDVTSESLRRAAGQVVAGVVAVIEVLTSAREPRVHCGQPWCAPCREAGHVAEHGTVA